jgi:hypothetical protein
MSTLFLHRFDCGVERQRYDFLLIYLSTNRLDEAEFRDAVNQEIDRDLIPDEIMLLVREPIAAQIAGRFAISETLIALKQRIHGKATISIRGFGVDGKQSSKSVAHGLEASKVPAETLVRRAITKIVRDRDGFVEAAGNYHFRLPSDRHSERFIRLPNILVEAAEISFIALGVLPFVNKDVAIVYIDTPSLFPVVSAISDHLRAFNPVRPPIIAENFRSYEGYRSFRFSVAPENLVLISTSSSGRLAQLILQLTGFNRDQFVHLLYFGPPSDLGKVVCDIQIDAAENPDGLSPKLFPDDYNATTCPLCAKGLPAVPLIGDHFELPGPQPIPLVIRRDDVSARLREIMERLVGHTVLSVGFGRANEGIARQFEISPSALLSSVKKTKRLPYVLAQAIPGTVAAVICLNEQSLPFARIVRKHVIKTGTLQLSRILRAERLVHAEHSNAIDAIVIVASVIESGRSLQDVSRDLRGIYPRAPQIYLVGLAKSRTDAHFDRLKSDLTQAHAAVPHEFIAIERIQLPSSSEPNAWTSELQLLSEPSFARDMSRREKIDWDKRLKRLSLQSLSMTDDLFVSARHDAPLRLQHGFALWPDGLVDRNPSQADVYFTIASVLQNRRAAAEVGQGRALRTDLFQQTLLDPNNFGRFSDGIIQASILRAARPNELNYTMSPEHSRDMARFARRMIVSSSRPRGEAAVELLIALGTRRLRLRPEDCKEILKESDNLPPRVERLRQIVSLLLRDESI